jgi:hypothetical protein
MTMSREIVSLIGKILVFLMVILVVFFFLNHMTNGKLVRFFIANILFWIPFTTLPSSFTSSIPV